MEKLLERPLSALDAIYTRRSVRSYTSERIDRSTVRALLDAAVQAPTAMLEQPWAFVVVQDAELLRRLSDRAKATWMGDAARLRPDAILVSRAHDDHVAGLERGARCGVYATDGAWSALARMAHITLFL